MLNEMLYNEIEKLEKEYTSGLKDFIYRCLTRISNKPIILNNNDLKMIKRLNYCVIDFDKISAEIEKMILGETNALRSMYLKDALKYSDKKSIPRFIFRSSAFSADRLTNIPKIIDFVIDKKESLKNINDQDSEILIEYLNSLLQNIYVASLFADSNEDVINDRIIDVESLLEYNKSFEDFDLDKELESIESIYNDDLFNESLEAVDAETKDEKHEKKEMEGAKDFREKLKSIGKSVLRVKDLINRGKLNVHNFIDKMNVSRNIFYKRHLGHIDHLYKNYGSEATIVENKTNGDPVKILFGRSNNYLSNLIDGLLKIYSDYNKHIDKLFRLHSFKDFIVQTNSYISYNAVKLDDNSKPNDIKIALRKDLRYKVAKLLLKDNDIYGHTIESIVEKKYPNIHHVMVSLFLPNPHEKPIEQSVNEIFNSADSFKIMDSKMKDLVKQTSMIVSKKILSVNVEQDFKKIYQDTINLKRFRKLEAKSLHNKTTNAKDTLKDLKDRLKVLKDHQGVLESFIPLFIYVSNAGNVLYDISVRIDKTCQEAVKSMLNVEKGKTKSGYNDSTVHSKKTYKTSTDKEEEEKKEKNKSVTKIEDKDEGNRIMKIKI